MKNQIFALIMVVTILSSCKHIGDGDIEWSDHALPSQLGENSADVGEAASDVKSTASKQTGINNSIGKEATAIQNASGNKFQKNTSKIYSELQASGQLVTELVSIAESLDITKEELLLAEASAVGMRNANAMLVKDKEKLVVERDKIQAKLDESTKKFLNKLYGLLIALGVVAVGISGYLAWGAIQAGQNPLKAGGIAVAGITVSITSIGLMYHGETIIKGVIVVIIVAVLSLAYKMFLDHKERKKAKEDIDLKDSVIEYGTKLTEQIKEEVLTTEQKVEWFGKLHSDGRAGSLQVNERVKAVIESTRKKINEADSATMS